MRSRDWFILGVRLMGAWFLAQGVLHFVSYVTLRWADYGELSTSFGTFPVVGYLLIALYFLLGTEHLARLCYGEEPSASEKTLLLDQPPVPPNPPNPDDSRSKPA